LLRLFLIVSIWKLRRSVFESCDDQKKLVGMSPCFLVTSFPGADFARGYIQNWLSGEVIPEKSAQKIFRAADRILKAGAPVVAAEAA
jgi:hypothetical protein